MSDQLDKLGTVLAVSNQINKDMLEVMKSQHAMMVSQHAELKGNYEKMRTLLEGQQKRQSDIIKIAIVAVVAIVVCNCLAFSNLAKRIDNGVEVLRHEHQAAASTAVPK